MSQRYAAAVRNQYTSNRNQLPAISFIRIIIVMMFMLDGSEVLVEGREGPTIDWGNVKPMFIMAMNPKSRSPSTAPTKSGVGVNAGAKVQPKDVDADDEDLMEAVIMNLETKPMEEDMLPGGVVAMDRIFGGNVARPNCFPYQVGLLLQRPKGLYWCGGSLISNEYVLTAAHCVDMAKRALIFLGAHEIKNAKEVGQQRLMVNHDNFIIYPTWNPRRLKDDIALVQLPDTIEFTSRIHPIALPKRSYEYRTFRDKLAIASGWGRYATGVHAISNELRFVKLQIVDGKTCKRSFPLSYRSTNICTSGRLSRSTCNGDSGGPLVLRRRNSKKRVLVGVTSFGSIFGCDRGFPAAFTKVASYMDWINDETGIKAHQDTSNAMLFSQFLRDYQKGKHARRLERTHPESLREMVGTIDANMQKYPDSRLLMYDEPHDTKLGDDYDPFLSDY